MSATRSPTSRSERALPCPDAVESTCVLGCAPRLLCHALVRCPIISSKI